MSLKRQTLWSVAPMLVVSVVNVFSLPLFLRFLGEEMYALMYYVVIFSGMFGFADLGLGVAMGRYVGLAIGKGDHKAMREYWGTGNLIAIPLLGLMALAFMGIGVFFGPKWFEKLKPENIGLLRACFVAGGLSLFFSYYAQLWVVLLQTHLNFRFTSILRVAVSLLQIIPAITIAYATRNPLYINLWSVLVGFLHLSVLVWYARRHYDFGFSLRSAKLSRGREMAVYTGKTFLALITGSVFASIDRLVLSRFASAAGFSYYTFCSNVGGRLQGLGGAVMGPVFHNTNRAVSGGGKSSSAEIYNEMFHFMFGWYALASIWTALWHPVLLRVWLDVWRGNEHELAEKVAPLFTPIILAYCITAMSSISAAQLSALNRMGTAIGFIVASGMLTATGVYFGWTSAGAVGVAYGFLASRIASIAQDLFVIRLINAKGWLDARTWQTMAAQCLLAGVFGLTVLFLPRDSFWNLVPAAIHGGLVSAWLLRHPFRAALKHTRALASPNLDNREAQPPGF